MRVPDGARARPDGCIAAVIDLITRSRRILGARFNRIGIVTCRMMTQSEARRRGERAGERNVVASARDSYRHVVLSTPGDNGFRAVAIERASLRRCTSLSPVRTRLRKSAVALFPDAIKSRCECRRNGDATSRQIIFIATPLFTISNCERTKIFLFFFCSFIFQSIVCKSVRAQKEREKESDEETVSAIYHSHPRAASKNRKKSATAVDSGARVIS